MKIILFKKCYSIILLMLALTLMTIVSLQMISASSVNYKSVDMPDKTWLEWQVISSTDNLNVEFLDKYSKTTDVWLISPIKQVVETYDVRTARFVLTSNTSNVIIPTTKNVYATATATTPSKVLPIASKIDYVWNDDLKATQRITEYGYTIKGNGEAYLKIGDATTIIGYVNQTGGDAYKGFNLQPNLNTQFASQFPSITLTQYTALEKTVVSVDNSTVVAGAGSFGTADCQARTGYPISSGGCSVQNIISCNGYFQYSSTVATSCLWIVGPNICVPASPCYTYSFHRFTFNVTKAGATNITIIGKTTIGITGTPGQTNIQTYYLLNSSGNWNNVGSVTCSNSVTVPCNYTNSTINVSNYINANGFINVTVQTDNLNPMSMWYAVVQINYRDIIIKYRTLTSLIETIKYRNPNLPLTIRWRTS